MDSAPLKHPKKSLAMKAVWKKRKALNAPLKGERLQRGVSSMTLAKQIQILKDKLALLESANALIKKARRA